MPSKDNQKKAEPVSQIEETSVPAKAVSVRKSSRELGASGTNLYAGILSEDHDSQLNGQTAFIQFDKMRRSDAQIRATLHAMELPIRTTRWYIEPALDESGEVRDEDKAVAEFVHDALFNRMEITFDDFLRQALTELAFGVSVFEKVYKVEDDKVFIKKLAWRKPTTIQQWITEDGAAGITQQLPSAKQTGENKGKNSISIPGEKLLIFTHQREGDNYEGISVLRSSFKHWKIKNTLYLFDNLRHERTSVGLPCITLPEGATDEDQDTAELVVRNVRATDNSGIVLPYGHIFEFKVPNLSGQGGTAKDIFESINHHNREIAKNILAQFLELGNTESGSRSLSEDQSSLFLLSLGAVAKQIAETVKEYLIKELVDLNFNGITKYPTLAFEKLGDVPYKEFSDAVGGLVDKGVISPDDTLEKHMREVLGLPPAQPDAEIDNGKKKVEPAPAKNKKETKEELDDLEAHEHAEDTDEQLAFKEICSAYDNEAIISLQNEARTPEDLLRLKKKGVCLNEFQDKATRPMTFAERRVNFTSLDKALEKFNEKLEEGLADTEKKLTDGILKQVKVAVEKNDTAAISKIKAGFKREISQKLTDIQKEMFEIGKRGAATEMGVPMPPTKAEVKGVMRVQNEIAVETALSNVENGVRAAVSDSVAKAGGITNLSATAATATASVVLERKMTRALNSLKTVATIGAVNLGRTSIFERYPEQIYAMQYSAVLDRRTTVHCLSLDGRVVLPGSSAFVEYSPPQHYQCRSIWVEILRDDTFKPKITGVPKSIVPTKSLDNFKDPKRPSAILKGSPAIKQIQAEIAERQAKLDKLLASGKYPNRQRQHEKVIKELSNSIKGKFKEAAHDWMVEALSADGVNFK